MASSPRARRVLELVWPVALAQVGAVWLGTHGRPGEAMVVGETAGVILVARVASRGRVDAWIGRAARGVGHVSTTMALTVVFACAIVPVWVTRQAWLRLRARAVGVPPTQPGWASRVDIVGAPTLTFAADPAAPRSTAARALAGGLVVTGLVVMAVGLDMTAGTLLGARPRRPALGALMRGRDGIRLDSITTRTPALAGASWRGAAVSDLRELGIDYWPLLAFRTRPHAGPTLHTDGWVRRSTSEPPPAALAPTVFFFGGSLAFGTGQRDGGTVASQVAGLAAADGLPVRVANQGQPGWTLWQSWLRFDQASSVGAPDAAVFLNGSEEARATEPVSGVASHVGFAVIQGELDDRIHVQAADPGTSGQLPRDLLDAYLAHSLVHRLLTRHPSAAPAPTTRQLPAPARRPTRAQVVSVYERGRMLASAIAEQRGVKTWFVWQPIDPADRLARSAAAAAGGGTVDLSRLLDGDGGAFLPDGSVNERGARLLAVALWRRLRPWAAAWYRTHH